MLLAPQKAELEGLKYIQENNKAFQTAEFSNLLNRKTTEYNKELENKEKSEIMIVNALQGKAPQTLIDNAKKIIDDGGTYTEVAAALGNYSLSQADRLDLKLKQAQIDKISADQIKETAAERKDRVALETEKAAKLPQLEEKFELIKKITENPAVRSAVGPTIFARGGIFGSSATNIKDIITGDKSEFLGYVSQLVNQEFLDSITELKKQGGTLGALSEKEGAKLAGAATALGEWEIRDEDTGKLLGYSVSEDAFWKEIETITRSTRTIYEAIGGVVPGTPEEQAAVDTLLNNVDETLLNSDNLYSEAGYN
jgi:hypothetical protein